MASVPHSTLEGSKDSGGRIMEVTENTQKEALSTAGTRTALSHLKAVSGRGDIMVRVAMVMLMAVLPGGLLVLAAFILARAVATQMKLEQGSQSRRLARAFATVKLRDVWTSARRSLR
ncbi:MAG: hypothetical protein U0228_20540 [Myxococcaceae bacterium]